MLEIALERLLAKRDEVHQKIINGINVQSLAEYRYQTGISRGINIALDVVNKGLAEKEEHAKSRKRPSF
jgi:hypothetical protein